MEDAENFVDLAFPMAGLSLLSPHAIRTPGTTPEGINVRDYDCLKLRRRGGSRPGLRRWIDQSLPLETTAFTDSTIYTILTQGLAAGSDQHLHLMFGFGAPASDDVATGLIQMLNVLVNPAGYALIDAYIDNHRGFARIHPEEALDPIFLVPIDSFPLEDEEPWSDSNGGFEDPSNPGNFVRNGGSGAGRNSRQTPNIVWNNPSSISPGTPLSSTQLNAVAYDPDEDPPATPLAGTYRYRPALETILELGQDQPLKVTFIPDDQATYRNSTKTVFINVQEGGFVQAKAVSEGLFGAASYPIAFDNDVTAGDLIVVCFSCSNLNGLNGLAATDTLGTTYSVTVVSGTSDNVTGMLHGIAAGSGPCTVTVTGTGGNFLDVAGAVLEYSGVDPLDPLDGTASNTVGTQETSQTTNAPAVSAADKILVGAIASGGSGQQFTADAGFTERANPTPDPTNTPTILVAEKDPTNVATAVTSTSSVAMDYTAVAATFNKA